MTWGPAPASGEDWVTQPLAIIQLGLFVGFAEVDVTATGASVPSPGGLAELPVVIEPLAEEVEPPFDPARDVPLPTWEPGAPGDPYRNVNA